MQREMNCVFDAHVLIVAGQPISHFSFLFMGAGMGQRAFGSTNDAADTTEL